MIKNQWYLVCFNNELKKGQILRRKIMGQEIVVFRTESGKISVLEDRCCHRNVHLSLGYVKGEHIKCGYHGWEFDSTGKCARIPSLKSDDNIPKAACIKHYDVILKHQCIWAYFGDEEKKPEAEVPPFNELDKWPMVYNYHLVKGSLKLVAESLFDSHHINHVHRKSIKTLMGNLHNEPPDYHLSVTEKSLNGWYLRDNENSILEKIYFGFKDKVETHFAFWFPHSSKLDLRFPAHLTMPSRQMVIYEHFYQVDEDHVMMIQITSWHKIFEYNPWFAKWFMLQKSMRIVEEDIAFLESNKYWHDKKRLNDLLIKPDELTFEFTRLWNKNVKENDKKTDQE
ncbi:MAG: aromatic ring-hydroxylating dioxygenase subunit alpha [Bacteroidetes bacterium]|nr:aromatic ring-hydroxylating dioxygenase subunit alpha [Bacteroidota bacterium]